ncbi:hypothetical protein [Microbacterium suwonense]|uniref:hypothetical protein n=1 Tax=Microbacterium suwonense TaxID=683047 RepID=UPI002573099E|nr:hypothetical protein [Microbacterium suwonense]
MLTKLYGLLLVVVGIVATGLGAAAGGWWAGLLLIAYGVYLILPGWKLVIW